MVWLVVRTAGLLDQLWAFETDDAYITLRYARHLAEGRGVVWNPGAATPVEGYSNFLFVLLGALAVKIGWPPLLALKVVSVGGLFAGCAGLVAIGRRWLGWVGAALPPLILTGIDGAILWTVSGLETAVYMALVVGMAALVFRAIDPGRDGFLSPAQAPSGRLLVSASVLGFLAAITRPEGPLALILSALALLMAFTPRLSADAELSPEERRRIGRQALFAVVRLIAPFAVLYGGYTAWRLAHFGQLLPNTVHCKAAYDGDPLVLVEGFWRTAWPLLVCSSLALRRLEFRHVLLWGLPVIYVAILFGVDPIIGYANRHFLPALALLSVTAVVGLVQGAEAAVGSRAPRQVLELMVVVGWLAVTASPRQVIPATLDAFVAGYGDRMELRREVGQWLEGQLGPEDTYLIGDAGRIPFITTAKVLDAFCLNSAATTRDPINNDPSRFVEYAFDQQPEMMVVHSRLPDALSPRPEYGIYPRLLAHPRFVQEYEYVRRFARPTGEFHYFVFRRKVRGG